MIKLDESDYIVHKIMQEIPTEFKTFMQCAQEWYFQTAIQNVESCH